MSYDLHGPWEKGNVWTGEYLNAHTNLTEIDSALDLLWRNNIDPAKVVLGLAFYGRASTVANTNCVSPGGCQFASGARALRCSHEISIMLNSEIDQIITEKNLAPTLYANAAVKVISWDDQWVAYDDDETMALKVEFAKSLCLGRVMVWAISHDTTEAKYTRALSRVTSRSTQGGGIFLEQDPLKEVTGPPRTITIQQCRWTNCNENCPSGWQEMVDNATPSIFFSSSLFNTVIKDETACDGDGYHKFCCPVTSNPPTCRWTSQKMENAKDHALLGTLKLDQDQNIVRYKDKVRLYAAHMTIPIKLLGRLLYTEPVYGHNGHHAILVLVLLDFRV